MGGFIALNRDPINDCLGVSPTRIPGASWTVLMRLAWDANYEPEVFQGIAMDRGDVCISQRSLCEKTGLSRKIVRNALKALKNAEIISTKGANKGPTRGQQGASEGANLVSVYHINIYEHIIHKNNEGAREGANKGPTRGQQGATSKEVKNKRIKEKDQNLSPDGDGSAPDLFPGESTKSKVEKPKSDPLTDPTIFLRRVEAEFPAVVLVWARDSGAMKTLLSARMRARVEDPQVEAWGLWAEFQDGRIDDTLKNFRTGEIRRAHDVPTFVVNYALLRERIGGGNGKGPKTGIGPPKIDQSDPYVGWMEKREQRRIASPHGVLWERVCGRLDRMVPSRSFEMWFRPAFIGRVEDGVVVLDVPTQIHADHIEDHHSGMVIAALREEGVDVKGFGAEVFNQGGENEKPEAASALPCGLQ